MSANLARRLAMLEGRNADVQRHVVLLMPWEIMPEARDDVMLICYEVVEPSPNGPKRLEYERNGIHPADDVRGSVNRHLYFGEPLRSA